ncbi:MAG: DNA-binding response regulator [Myxococcales bacterium]|nr:DNA-binding response regulator [Myxococcales bacterium]
MRRQTDRYAMSLPVELFATGQKQCVALADLSRSGMFLQVSPPPPVGAEVHIAIAPEGRRVVTAAIVTHSLVEADARALGRQPGVGIAFRAPIDPADELFAIAVDRLVRAQRAQSELRGAHIVVADPSTRLLERMSTSFGAAGFSVAIATNGLEALAACLRRTPDVVLLDRALPVFDGFRVLHRMANLDTLAAVPVIITSTDPHDLAPAFERGAMDFIPKPFATFEMIARARRLAYGSSTTERAVLHGALGAIGLPALLTMLGQERKTGRLVLTGSDTGWIDLFEGQIVGAGPGKDLLSAMVSLLGWNQGTFELSPVAPPRGAHALSVTHVLLEHARHVDEASGPRRAIAYA